MSGGGGPTADVGWRADVGGHRRRHRRNGPSCTSSTDRVPAVSPSAPSRSSISVASWSRCDTSGRGLRLHPAGRQRLSHSPQLRVALWQRDLRAHPGWAGLTSSECQSFEAEEVVGLAHHGRGVDVEVAGGTSLRADYLVGCDGLSVIRKSASIDFPGVDPSTSFVIAEVGMAIAPEIGVRPEGGWHRSRRSPPGRRAVPRRVARAARVVSKTLESRHLISESLVGAYGTNFECTSSRFTIPASGLVSRRACAFLAQAMLPTCTPRTAAKASTSWCAGRREPGLEARPGGEGDLTRRPA